MKGGWTSATVWQWPVNRSNTKARLFRAGPKYLISGCGAQGEIRTHTVLPASPSSWCVCQFHHLGEAGRGFSTAAPSIQGYFGVSGFGASVFGASVLGVSGFGVSVFFAASCAAMFRRARSTESLCDERQASVSEVHMKMIAQT